MILEVARNVHPGTAQHGLAVHFLDMVLLLFVFDTLVDKVDMALVFFG